MSRTERWQQELTATSLAASIALLEYLCVLLGFLGSLLQNTKSQMFPVIKKYISTIIQIYTDVSCVLDDKGS